jgi:hypothetical protein
MITLSATASTLPAIAIAIAAMTSNPSAPFNKNFFIVFSDSLISEMTNAG